MAYIKVPEVKLLAQELRLLATKRFKPASQPYRTLMKASSVVTRGRSKHEEQKVTTTCGYCGTPAKINFNRYHKCDGGCGRKRYGNDKNFWAWKGSQNLWICADCWHGER